MTLAAVLTPAAAKAADGISEFEARPTAVYGQLGLGTPLGFVGVEAEHTFVPNASVSAGIGLGTGRAAGGGDDAGAVRWPLVEVRHRRGPVGRTLPLGGAVICIENDCTRKSGTVAWGNLEIGGAHRFRSGFAMKYFGGYGRLIAGDLVCDEAETYGHCTIDPQERRLQLIYTVRSAIV